MEGIRLVAENDWGSAVLGMREGVEFVWVAPLMPEMSNLSVPGVFVAIA